MRILFAFVLLSISTMIRAQVIDIPVVVHVLYHDAQDSVPAELISTILLDSVNADFRRTNDDAIYTQTAYLPIAADTEIQFHLATEDPDGNPTTGIIYKLVDTIFQWQTQSMMRDSMGGEDPWDHCRYLNIYSCNYYPESAHEMANFWNWGPPYGVVFNPFAFMESHPTRYYRNITHYIAHLFGLGHAYSFQCTDDDGIADTPIQRPLGMVGQQYCQDPDYFVDEDECDSLPLGKLTCNFMLMTNDGDLDCMNMFTLGQKARMREFIAERFIGMINPDLNCNVGVEDMATVEGAMLFPNPTDGAFNLRLPFGGAFRLLLSDALGRERLALDLTAKEHEDVRVNHNLPPGIYHLYLNAGGKTVIQRLVVL